jgi:voltage-gated potassium channel
MNLRRQLIIALLLLIVVLGLAVVGYRWLGGPDVTLLDALYMAVVTFSTVGYGEIVDTTMNPTLRIFNIFVILFGIGIMLYVFSSATAFVVEGELHDIFRRRKMMKQIRDLHHHFIICGAGETGLYVLQELLKTGHSFVVIDHDELRLEKIRNVGGFPTIVGDASDEEVLVSAGLDRAKGLVTVLPDDKDNLMISVTARQKNSAIRIVARCSDNRMAQKMMSAGATSTVAPSMIGGMRLASELIRPHVVGFLDLMLREHSRTLRVEEIVLKEGTPWDGITIAQTELHRRFELLALGLRRPDGQMIYNPQANAKVASGDVIIVMGDMNQIWKARAAAGDGEAQLHT